MKYWEILKAICRWPFEDKLYYVKKTYIVPTRFGLPMTVPKGFKYDGSTASPNISLTGIKAWEAHDVACWFQRFDDGSPMRWKQANTIMADLMRKDGWPRKFRRIYWKGINAQWGSRIWEKRAKVKAIREKLYPEIKDMDNELYWIALPEEFKTSEVKRILEIYG